MATSAPSDEAAIRALIVEWMEASAAGENERVLELMAEDAVLLSARGKPKHGRAAFAAQGGMIGVRREGKCEVQEVRVFGDWGYAWTYLMVTTTPLDGRRPWRSEGPTLSVLRKEEGKWLLFRNADMVLPIR